ncbi:unnamed protein product, partial [Polarella glacialis]
MAALAASRSLGNMAALAASRQLGTVLVAGGAGWVGSALVLALAERSAELGVRRVVAADCKAGFQRGLLARAATSPGGSIVEDVVMDVTDANSVEEAFAHWKPDTVFNLAAIIDHRPEADAELMDRVNTEGVRLLVAFAEQYGTQAFVHISTLDVSWTGSAHSLQAP